MKSIKNRAKTLLKKGLSLKKARQEMFPELYGKSGNVMNPLEHSFKLKDAIDSILSVLGFKTETEYRTAMYEARRMRKIEVAEEAEKWHDEEKESMIKELFNKGARLQQIRWTVFGSLLSGPDLRRYDIRHQESIVNHIILIVLDCKDWDDYKRKQRNVGSRKRYHELKREGKAKNASAINAALERDGHRCVLTGQENKLVVHHIDGNRANNDLRNLVTVTGDVHKALHNGARAYSDNDLISWKKRKPEYVAELKKRMGYFIKYVEYLHSVDHPTACIESITAYELVDPEGPCVYLRFSPVKKRREGLYHVVVLQPTGLHQEPTDFKTIDVEDLDDDPFSEHE